MMNLEQRVNELEDKQEKPNTQSHKEKVFDILILIGAILLLFGGTMALTLMVHHNTAVAMGGLFAFMIGISLTFIATIVNLRK
jgi:hypothetical protein